MGGEIAIEKKMVKSKSRISNAVSNAVFRYKHSDDFKPHALLKCDQFDVITSEYESDSDICVIERVYNECESPETLKPMVVSVEHQPQELDYEMLYCEF